MEEKDEFKKYFNEQNNEGMKDGLAALAHLCYQYYFSLIEEGFNEFQALMLTRDYQHAMIS